jgi:seryl-tRNA synthetase
MFLDLQKEWKTIGPIPRKHSDQVWKRFRSACDKFFNKKSEFFSNIEKEHKENLEKKETLIKEIQDFKPLENQSENINKIKELQARWTEIGFVANSQKDRLYTEYRSAVNSIYEKLNLNKSALEVSNFNSKVEVLKETGEVGALQSERSRILRRIQELTAEINQYENNMGFFSSGSESILKDFEKKINKAKDEIKTLKEKKKSIDLAEREIKNKDKKDDENN